VNKYAIIVTPNVLLREGIASLLRDNYKVATAARPAVLQKLSFPKERPLVAIVGTDWQNGTARETAESIRLLRSSVPHAKVVLVLETNGPVDLQSIVALSSDACIFNVPSRDSLLKIVELTLSGQRLFVLPASAALENEVSEPLHGRESFSPMIKDWDHLSSRERQILISLAEGKSNKAIARLYNLSEATIKFHLKTILRKIKVQNRTQAAIWAIEHGLRDPAG
jgi:two-component system nitrate/nitrite response regulator NarL